MPNNVRSVEATRNVLLHAFDFSQSQVKSLLSKYPADYYPMYTVGGKFGLDQKRWTHWCDGFYPGMMFLFADYTGSNEWLEAAIKYSTPLEERQYDRSVHDLGFIFFSTYLHWLRLGGPAERINPVLIQAGKTMAMRFMEKGQYLRSFVEPASLFIDIMMNVGTIFNAGIVTGDQHLLNIAHRWSRGLAWSLYGFTRSFGQTRRAEHLETASLNAEYYLAHTPANGVTPWDYDAPEGGPLSRNQVDTSAAAIAASGLLDLADFTPDPVKAEAYRSFALNSLVNLSEFYLGENTPRFEGILNGGVYHIHKDLGIHEAVLFGEYFFVEALLKALRTLDRKPIPSVVTPYPEDTLPAWAKTWADGPTEEELPAPADNAAAAVRP